MIENLDLMKGARVAVEICMGTKPDEEVLIVTDTSKLNIGYAFAMVAKSIGAETSVAIMTPRKMHGNEPPNSIGEAMKGADVILMPTSTSLSHTNAREEASKKGARIASMPTITEEIIKGPLMADYARIKEKTLKLTDILTDAEEAVIITKLGTNLKLNLKNRKGLADTGIFHNKGDFGNLPAGEAYIPPVENYGDGDLVIDGAMAGIGILSKPIKISFKNGRIINIEGGYEAEKLRKILENSDENSWKIAELGIGTNDEAYLMGNVLLDEKVYGTVHVAIGDNIHMGGFQKSSVHLDGIIKNPTLILDGKTIIESGVQKNL
ncbi:MAG: aminopeptidase [Thermoplasmata archaeon]